jgi:hypothetical protein
MVIEVPVASFGPEVVHQEAPKNVQGLSNVGVPTCVVTMEVLRIVIQLEHGLT